MVPLVDVLFLLDFIVIRLLKYVSVILQRRFGVVQVVHYIKHIYNHALTLLIAYQIKI